MSHPVTPIPDPAQPLAPYLIVRDAARAITFYAQAFGATELYRLAEPSGKIGHAELKIGSSKFMLADEYPEMGAVSPEAIGGSPVSLHLYVEDVDATIERAVTAGATLVRPATDQFFGERSAHVTCPFGHKWHLSMRNEEVSPSEMQRRWNAMLAGP